MRFPLAAAFSSLNASHGLLVGGTGSGEALVSGDVFSLDPATGNQVAHISNTSLDFVGDLDFRPVPEPLSLMLAGLGLLAILSCQIFRNE